MSGATDDRNFKNHAKTQKEEDAYDFVKDRVGPLTSTFGSIAHLIKGALGGGILGGPVAYKKGGVLVAMPLNIIIGMFMGYCLFMLVRSKQVLLRRTRKPNLSYADTGEAALMLFPKPKIARFAKAFRYTIDTIVCMDLFGACCTYQIVVAKSLKQLVENVKTTSLAGKAGYPSLRVYLAVMIPFFILICLIRHLKFLAPFSHVANMVVASSILMTIYYCSQFNPGFENLKLSTTVEGSLQFIGMSVFAMSCAGVVVSIEGNMKNPKHIKLALIIGHCFIIFSTVTTSFFGYSAFLEEAQAPFTINFPMTTVPKLFKAAICIMLYFTHGLNFWVPFNLCWFYMKNRYAPERQVFWERIFRAIFVITIGCVAIIFPSITALMGLIGCFCLSNMAIIFPNIITILVVYERPGLGRFKWRLWRCIFFLTVGAIVFVCGSVVNINSLLDVFRGGYE